MKHQLYTQEDNNAPDSIKNIHGEIVLDLCRICGKAESELSQECERKKKLTPLAEAISGLKAEKKRLESMSEVDQFDAGCISTIDRDIEFLSEFLPKEQESIELAHLAGQVSKCPQYENSYGKSNQYFHDNFTQE